MSDTAQVKIKFVTRDEDATLHLTDEALLFVPVSLKRYGLSEIVNHLLKTEKPVPFDFLINGEILTRSIDDYLIANGLSSETFLTLEYKRSILPPSFLASFNNEDWISSIDVMSSTTTVNNVRVDLKILAGSYDGIVRLYNSSGKVEHQFAGHQGIVKDVKFVNPTRIISGGNDRQLRLWKLKLGKDVEDDDEEEGAHGQTVAILEGHKAPVVSVAVDEKSNRILSAGYDDVVGLWSSIPKEMNSVEFNKDHLSSQSKKRLKLALADTSIKRKSPLSFLESHQAPVEGVIFDENDNTVGYSCSQDHTFKTWDLVTSKCVDTKTTSYSLLSILNHHKMIICGSSARHIIMSDPRSSQQQQLVGHSNFVVNLSLNPKNEYMFSSASFDGTVKIWDMRANKSIYTITREDGSKKKVFDVCWNDEVGIVSGGEDKKLQINNGDI